jgi:hypothetical protein
MRNDCMNPIRTTSLAMAIALLGACASVPTGPTVAVMPAPAKPFEVFQNDDLLCRGYAQQQIGGATAQAQQQQVVEGAVAGAAVGAAAGALVGHGHGHAVGAGAGTGLVVGTLAGQERASGTASSLQQRYDLAYAQCMYARGNQVPGFPLAQPLAPPSR